MERFKTCFEPVVREKKVSIMRTLDKNLPQYFIVSIDTEWQGFAVVALGQDTKPGEYELAAIERMSSSDHHLAHVRWFEKVFSGSALINLVKRTQCFPALVAPAYLCWSGSLVYAG